MDSGGTRSWTPRSRPGNPAEHAAGENLPRSTRVIAPRNKKTSNLMGIETILIVLGIVVVLAVVGFARRRR